MISVTGRILKQTNKQTTTELIDTENRLVVSRVGRWEVGKMGEGGQKVQTSSYKLSNS